MSKYYLFQDTKKCIGCHSCEVACKLEHDLPAGPRMFKVIQIGPVETGDDLLMNFMAVTCLHCDRPACVLACPTGAMQRRDQDGIVFVDPALCVGCKTCMSACPWGAPQWNPEAGKAVKCDYCIDRLDEGKQPACVTICTTHCLHFGLAEIAPRVRRERYAKAMTSLE